MKIRDILAERYTREIESWDWAKLEKNAKENCFVDDEDNIIASEFLGSVFAIMPSGKYYTCWTSNQTAKDCIKDEIFSEVLEKIANSHGFSVTSGEGDPCDIFIQKVVDFEDTLCFINHSDFERAEELNCNLE